MSDLGDWEFPEPLRPKSEGWAFDVGNALDSVLSLSAEVPADAFTASILGTERAGNGVLIDRTGLVLTIGYLITEAERIWLGQNSGKVVPGHVVAYDFDSGFGLVQALAALDGQPLALGRSRDLAVGSSVIVAGAGGRRRALAAKVVGKREFAGYWEYVLDEAIFTAPAHPHWGGTGLLGPDGKLYGIGSLYVQQARGGDTKAEGNMIVPIDLLPPILESLTKTGTSGRPVSGLSRAVRNGCAGDGRRLPAVRFRPVSGNSSRLPADDDDVLVAQRTRRLLRQKSAAWLRPECPCR